MKLKILFLSANPHQDLSPDEEYRVIDNVVKKSNVSKSVELIPKFAVRINDLISAINEEKPHFVHFTGHGTDKGELRLTDNNGNMDELISTESLEKLFSTVDSVKFVFLSACYSSIQSEAISSHIDYVIGMKRAIKDKTAIAFAETFYSSFLAERSIEEAFNQAIVRLETEYKDERDIPELKKNSNAKGMKIQNFLQKGKNKKIDKKYFLILSIIAIVISLFFLIKSDNSQEIIINGDKNIITQETNSKENRNIKQKINLNGLDNNLTQKNKQKNNLGENAQILKVEGSGNNIKQTIIEDDRDNDFTLTMKTILGNKPLCGVSFFNDKQCKQKVDFETLSSCNKYKLNDLSIEKGLVKTIYIQYIKKGEINPIQCRPIELKSSKNNYIFRCYTNLYSDSRNECESK